MRAVIDIEGNGLLDTITQMWCSVAYDIDTAQWYIFDFIQGNTYEEFCNFLAGVDTFIGHNILGYDIDAIEKLTGYRYNGNIVDTLVYSRTLNPDRKIPEGCPTHIPDQDGKKKLVGAHSLEAYGYLVETKKPRIDDWTTYSPKMVHRCKEDVWINYKTLLYLLEEAGLNHIVSIK